MKIGSPIVVVLVRNSLSEKLASLLLKKTDSSSSSLSSTTLIASIDGGSAAIAKAKLENDDSALAPSSNHSSSASSTSSSSGGHTLPLSSILAIVFGVLLVVFLLVGLFCVFFYMQKARLREEREKLEVRPRYVFLLHNIKYMNPKSVKNRKISFCFGYFFSRI